MPLMRTTLGSGCRVGEEGRPARSARIQNGGVRRMSGMSSMLRSCSIGKLPSHHEPK